MSRRCSRRAVAAAAAMLSVVAHAATADLIDVQFGQPAARDGFPPTPAYQGAAVIGAPGDRWNLENTFAAIGTHGWGATDRALTDAAGAATGATLSYSADAPVSRTTPFSATPYAALMTSYLSADGPPLVGSASSGPGVVTFSGLLPDTEYQLILYSGADWPGRATRFTAGDGSVSEVVRDNGQSTFAEGVNYASLAIESTRYGQLSILVTHADDLTAFPQGNLNSIQFVGPIAAAVPEPGTWALMACGLAGLGLRRLRLRRPGARGRPSLTNRRLP